MTRLIISLPMTLALVATLACALAALSPAASEQAILASNCAGVNFADFLCQAARF